MKQASRILLLTLLLSSGLSANGIDRNGAGAKSMGMAGASLADFDDAINSMAQNPAALGFLESPDFYVTVAGAWGSGSYRNRLGEGGKLDESFHVLPEVVLRTPLSSEVAMGLSVIPDSSRVASWYFRDPAGGAGGGTSYGWQHHESEITNVRAAVALGWQVTETLSLGGSVGVVYTRNELHSPYIFQSHPGLAGMKTMLDLETDGFGVNGDLAAAWKVTEKLSVALTYRTPTKFKTEGDASGDIGRQLRSMGLNVPGKFHYDADVGTALPQKLAVGASYQAAARLRLAGQVEWVNWSRAYDNLNVKLSNGSNESINGVVGSDKIEDEIPLEWEDRFVYRAGVEFDLTQSFLVRAGYAYGKSPVPDSTLLPMTAAISEHTLAAGLGYVSGPLHVDLAYQHDLKASQRAGANGITGTEYDNSTVNVQAHWVGMTVGMDF